MHAAIGGDQACRDLDHGRLLEVDDDEQIEQREDQDHDRRDHAEEQIGDIGRLPAVAGLDQLFPRFLLAQPFRQVEALHHGLHVLLGRLPQPRLVATRQPFALALTQLLALDRDRLEPAAQVVAGQQRHRQGQHGGRRPDGREQRGQEPRIGQFLEQEFDHGAGQKSKLIIFFMTNTPIIIQRAEATSMMRPTGVVHKSSM